VGASDDESGGPANDRLGGRGDEHQGQGVLDYRVGGAPLPRDVVSASAYPHGPAHSGQSDCIAGYFERQRDGPLRSTSSLRCWVLAVGRDSKVEGASPRPPWCRCRLQEGRRPRAG